MQAIEAAPDSAVAAAGPSFYARLGIEPTATRDQVRTAYLTLAKAWHTDRKADERERQDAKRRFHDLAEAYTVLSDNDRRREYDLALAQGIPSSLPLPPLHPLHTASDRTGPAPYGTLALVEAGPARPESPFPGYRVPPGGYPQARAGALPPSGSPLARPELPFFHSDGPDDLASRIEASFVGMHDLALRGDLRYLDRERPRHRGHSPGYRHGHNHHHGDYGHHGWNGYLPHTGDQCKTARKEWTEASTERNGDRVAKAGRHEVTYYEDGTTKWRSQSTTIISHAHHYRHHYSPEYGTSRPLLNHSTSRPPSPGLIQYSPHRHAHHAHHRHRSHSSPPLALGPPHASPAHVATRSPGGYIPGPARHYDGYLPHSRGLGGYASDRYERWPAPEHGYSSPLFGHRPEWKERERELVL